MARKPHLCLGTAMLMLAMGYPAFGQTSAAYDVFLPPDHQLRRQLEDAKTALDDGEFNDAVRLLGVLLLGDADGEDALHEQAEVEDYFLEPPTEGAAQRSLKAEARRLLATLPKEGLDAYQLLYGHEAGLMLDDAVKHGDVDALTDITRKYFYTDAGYSAAMLLGRHYLSRGQPLAAALALKQLHELPAAQKFEPELSLLLASSWLLAGQSKLAEDVLDGLRQAQPRAELFIAGQKERLPADGEDAVAWLRKQLGNLKLDGNAAAEQWFVYRGNAARNAPTKGGVPLAQELWAVPTPNDPDQQKIISDQQEQYAKQRVPALPALQPLVVRHTGQDKKGIPNDVVITRTPSRLLAVDFHTGERVWFYPPQGQEPSLSEPASFSTPPSGADSPEVIKLKQRTWSDAPYGQISSDGTRVYFVQDLGLADRVGPQQIVVAGGFIRTNPDRPKPFNQLMALELAREGYQVWSVGGEDGGDEPKLAGAFFLGPPLPLMDKLYALAEVNGDIRLVVLDPTTGRLHWQQQLCGVDNEAILADSSRRLGGAVPSFSEGVLICPTSAGAVVAVDVAKRSLLWGYQYLEPPKEARPSGGFFPVRNSGRSRKQPGEGWADSSITIVGDKVLLTPVEHDEIICLDLVEGTIDGKPLWKHERGEGLLVACVYENKVIVVKKDKLQAYALDDGKSLWQLDIPGAPKSMPSGRGFLSGSSYFLPLTSGELAQFDLQGDEGKVADVLSTRGVLGNLICYRDTVISQGASELATFYQREALGRIVAERLKSDPDDAWALARHAELLLKDGKRREALTALRKSYELEPDDGTKARLVDTLLAALAEDFAGNQELAVEAESLIDRPDQRAVYRRLMAEGLQKTGKHAEAFEFYAKIIDDASSPALAGQSPGGDELQAIDDNLKVRPQRWIRSRLAHLLRAATPEARQAMDAEIDQRLQDALADNSITSLRRFVEFFGEHPAANAASLALAQRLWISGEALEAELILTPLVESADQPIAARATAQMGRLLGDAGHVEEAAAMYARLRDALADVDCGEGKTGRQVFEELAEQSAIAKKLHAPVEWPQGQVTFAEHDNDDNRGPKLGYSTYQHVYPSAILQWRGPHPAGARMVLDRNRRVFTRDGSGQQDISVQLNGAETTRSYIGNYPITHAKLTGHLAMLAVGYELFALDMLRGTSNGGQRVLWRENLASGATSDENARLQAEPKAHASPWGEEHYSAGDDQGRPIVSFAAPAHQGVCFRRWEQLVCVNPLRPEVVHWVRDGVGLGADVFGDGRVIVVIDYGSDEAAIISALDGQELGRLQVGSAAGHWGTLGRRILRWNENEDKSITVAMLDPWDSGTGELRAEPIVWSHRFSAGAKGTIVEQDEAAVMELNGQLTLIDLQTGELRFQTKLDAQTELETLHVLRGRDEYIVIPSSPIEEGPDGVRVRTAPGIFGSQGQYSPAVKGQVFALDRKSGESLWPSPAVVEHFALPLEQPTRLPVLLFMRNVSADAAAPNKWETEILCLDKRDGRPIFHKNDIPGETRVYRLVGDEKEKSAAIMLPGISYTLQWTDKPRPPQPPAQVTMTR